MHVVVVDSRQLAAQCLGAALARCGPGVVVTMTRGADTPVELAELRAGDVVVLSAHGDGPSAAAAVRSTRAVAPHARLVCLVAAADDATARAAAAEGSVVLDRNLPLADLVADLLGVTRTAGPRQCAPQRASRTPVPLSARFLTPREHEVLELLAAARSTDAIAGAMGITTATARGYVQSVIAKLGVHSRVEAVAFAARHDLLLAREWTDAM